MSKIIKKTKIMDGIEESLNKLSEKLLTLSTIDEFSKAINKFLAENFRCFSFGIFLIEKNGFLKFKTGKDWKTTPNRFKISKNGIIGWTLKSKTDILIEDISLDKRKLEGNKEIKSIYVIPLLWKLKTIGVLCFGLKKQKKWHKKELKTFKKLGKIIADIIPKIELLCKLADYSKEIDALNEYINSLIDRFPSGIIIINKDGTVKFINKIARKLFDISAKRRKKIMIEELFEKKHATVNPLLKTIEENKPLTRFEINIIDKNGGKNTIGFSTSLLKNGEGKITGAIGLMRGLTKIKEMEKRLMRQDRLIALGEMSAGMAHEIRNPLAGIKTGVEYLERLLDKKYRPSVKMIIKEIDRLNRIVTDMTLYANRPPIRSEQINIENLLNVSLAFMKSTIAEKSLKTITKLGDDIPPLQLDTEQIREVFDNIILNAVQSTEENGKITISTHIVKDGKMVEVRIIDTGIGIPKENKEKIFNPFFTTKKGGTGLGLSICHRIIAEHNGDIIISSKEGRGTTVRILLPIKPAR